ncbi:MAG: protease inhibitor I42 family protein [Pyrinomonadaceae bacterium]
MPEVTLSKADNGKSIEARPGDRIVIHLEENPTTGYRWTAEQTDDATVELQDSDYTPAGTGIGGGGERVMTFEAKAAGTANLRLKMWRQWEGDSSATERFNVTLRVKD